MLVSQLLTYRVEHIVTTTILSVNSLFVSTSALAQIVPDGTLNTQVNVIEGQQKITGGIEKGNNLFHSFREFSPTADFVTHFDNNNDIQNIFTRVTGDSASLIDGLIRSNGSASLFIINPAGIIFGNNAQLEIGGSFITTTAESIIFDDGTIFGTQINNTPPLLTVSIPIGLQYGNSPGAISSNNTEPLTLDVSPENQIAPGNTIALLGGDIELKQISIEALSGNVEIGAVAEGEIVGLLPNINGWQFDYQNVGKFNNIKISQQSRIDTTGQKGIINLQGREIFLNPGLEIINSTNTDIDGGKISLSATNTIDLNNIVLATEVAILDRNFQLLTNSVKGKGGDIIIAAKDIKIKNGSVISASTLNEGDGGDIILNASQSIDLSGFNDFFPSNILNVVFGSGDGGNVEINTRKLVMTDGTRIDSSSFNSGKAGNIIINADESIFVSGKFLSDNTTFNSGFFASSGFEGFLFERLGESGNINVKTPRLILEDGGEISVSNFGTGNAGDIEINAGELSLNDDGQITAITASGDGGSIHIKGSEIVLKDTASIATTADFDRNGGDGDGGNIDITTDHIVLFDDSTINANAFAGNGGNITITTKSLFTQNEPENTITASSELGVDGIVEIKTPNSNSKLETTQVRITALAGEESLDTSCDLGNDFYANRFVYAGRGGMRKGPFDEIDPEDSIEFIEDLGLEESPSQAGELSTNHIPQNNRVDKRPQSITEATAWIVNDQGKVELIAQASNNALPYGCLFNQGIN